MKRTDVAVLGGGPAGAVAAIRLWRLGYGVVLWSAPRTVAASRFDTLTSNALAFLRREGLHRCLDRAVVSEPVGTTLWWREAEELLSAQSHFQVVVERNCFDRDLRSIAESEGVQVIEQVAPRPRRIGARWRIGDADARFLIDARGRVANRGAASAPPLAAMCRVWSDGSGTRTTHVQASPDGWVWACPAGPGRIAITCFLDSEALKGLDSNARHELWLRQCSGSKQLQSLCTGYPEHAWRVVDATAKTDPAPIGDGQLRVGDAAVAIDPMSSQGLAAALRGALHASAAVHTLLSGTSDEDAVFEFYAAAVQTLAAQHQAMTIEMYASQPRWRERPFWLRRSGPERQSDTAPSDADSLYELSSLLTKSSVAALISDRIRRVPGVDHPGFGRPVVTLGGMNALQVLSHVNGPAPLPELHRRLQPVLPPGVARSVLLDLVRRGVLIRATSPPRQYPSSDNPQG